MALLYERISTHVLEEIRSGALGPGDRVASEMELAAQFEVSRITSKRALEVLREAGLIERIRGKGSFVVQNLPDLDGVSTPLRGRITHPARPRRHSGAIGLVIPDISEAYGLELLCAIEERCAEYGAHLLVRRTRGRQADEEQAVESLVASGEVDGMIVFPVHGDFYNASLLRQVLDGYPMVLVDRHLSGIPVSAVHTDNVAASQALTERLLDLGHRHIAFVSPPPQNTSSIEDRLAGFRAAFAQREPGPHQAHQLTSLRSTLPGSFTPESVLCDLETIRGFRAEVPEVTAFVACEYNLARMVDRALDRPHDLVISCFDSPGDPIAGPPYLHVRQNQREMGRQAVDLLLAQLRGESVPKLSIVPFELVDANRN
ncbi:transcriptional regulator, GntR family with LacI sensor [Kribbella flavida DSM 17836]|uniref:Transcriptional regulator, GntR family with LacI sensor n=1 Tax=Kribbella flavida (strain DSM 17836 / JCM 10339 / NBRC 14399) TaxID=479435 RepID=D2PKU8_KRIFD|nr:substrate-binding domain-containing protein [Kribbella flavida]ADB32415.1 transcriptional regulator, GntR family with LacI sensor [Kribbella flavida DSM 17836]